MRIVLVGAGNLATNIGRALVEAGHELLQVYSRTEQSAERLAALLHCSYTTELDRVVDGADVYIIAVKDGVHSGCRTREPIPGAHCWKYAYGCAAYKAPRGTLPYADVLEGTHC